MKIVDINPAASVEPDFDKKVGIVPASPVHIVGTGVKIAPYYPVPAGGHIFTTLLPDRLNGTFFKGVVISSNPEVRGDHAAVIVHPFDMNGRGIFRFQPSTVGNCQMEDQGLPARLPARQTSAVRLRDRTDSPGFPLSVPTDIEVRPRPGQPSRKRPA